MKKCYKCKEEKYLDQFTKDKSKKDGLNSACKVCSKLMIQTYYKENREKVKASRKIYNEKNKDKNKEYWESYYSLNKKSLLIKAGEWYYENKEEYLEYRKLYNIENRDKIKQYEKYYYETNKEAVLGRGKEFRQNNPTYGKEWFQDNKEKVAMLSQKYREQYPHRYRWRQLLSDTIQRLNQVKKDSTHKLLNYSALELKEHLDKQGMDWNFHQIDHKIPLSWFEEYTPPYIVNDLRNLQPLDPSTNQSKLNRYMDKVDQEYLEQVKNYMKEEFKNGTHFFNASVLDESYDYTQKPMTFDWDKESNTIEFI